MNVLYLHQYFATPDGATGTRSYEFARRLVAAGHTVTVVTSRAALSSDAPSSRQFEIEGVRVVALDVPYDQSMPMGRRLRAFFEFAIRAFWASRTIDADVVLATSTPLTIALPGAFAARRAGAGFVLEIRDLWPSIPIAMGALRSPVSRWLAKALERWAYRSADHVVALSPGMAAGVVAEGVDPDRVTVIPNSSDIELFGDASARRAATRERLGLDDRQRLVLYTGSFGMANRVDYLVDVAERAADVAPHLRFLLVGAGSEFETVCRAAEEAGVLDRNTTIERARPKHELVDLMGAADVVVSVMAPIRALEDNSANKVFDGFAAGRPVVVNHGGWLVDVLEDSGAGFRLDRDPAIAADQLGRFTLDDEALAAAGTSARHLAETDYSRDRHAAAIEGILRACARSRPSSPLRVAVIDLLGVAPAYDVELVQALRGAGARATLAAVSPHRQPDFYASRGFERGAPVFDVVSRAPASVLKRRRLRLLLKGVEYHANAVLVLAGSLLRRPDIVHLQWVPMIRISPIERFIRAALDRLGVPVVYTAHNVLPHDTADVRTRTAYGRWYGSVSRIICHAHDTAARLEHDFGIPSGRVDVVRHGPLHAVDLRPATADDLAVARTPSGRPVVLCLGWLRPHKGIDTLVRAWASVEARDAVLVIAGEGDAGYAAGLRRLVTDLDLGDRVDFRLGHVPDAEHDALHRVASVAVFPYRQISQSGALMTAMGHGRAIVATRVGGFPETIEDGRNGLLVEVDDPEGLAKAIDQLLADDELRNRLGNEAAADVEGPLSWDAIAHDTLDVYRRTISARNRTGI